MNYGRLSRYKYRTPEFRKAAEQRRRMQDDDTGDDDSTDTSTDDGKDSVSQDATEDANSPFVPSKEPRVGNVPPPNKSAASDPITKSLEGLAQPIEEFGQVTGEALNVLRTFVRNVVAITLNPLSAPQQLGRDILNGLDDTLKEESFTAVVSLLNTIGARGQGEPGTPTLDNFKTTIDAILPDKIDPEDVPEMPEKTNIKDVDLTELVEPLVDELKISTKIEGKVAEDLTKKKEDLQKLIEKLAKKPKNQSKLLDDLKLIEDLLLKNAPH